MERIQITKKGLLEMVYESVCKAIEDITCHSFLTEDMTRGQVDNQIEDYIKSRDFEKRVNNIVVDVLGDFIENMWTKKSFWKNMIKRK